jgi:predicted metal-dependent HD superfamily phosphohydrolase
VRAGDLLCGASPGVSHARACGCDALAQLINLGGPERLAWAIWFHDVIYDPKSSNNEVESAARFSRRMGDILPPDRVADGERLILATDPRLPRGHATDEPWMTDLDLAVLGSPAPAYKVYVSAVRKEYAFVPDEAFAAGRAEVMGRFLQQPRIYLTEEHAHLEDQARVNIQSEIDELRKQIH